MLALAVLLLLTVVLPAQVTVRIPIPADLRLPSRAPLGMPGPIPAPADNPLTEAGFELGKRLFFDPILSVDHTVSCASCHLPDHGFASPERLPAGVMGRHAKRHSPTLFNRAWGSAQRWDGKARTLEDQVLLPISDPNEMNLPLDEALRRIEGDAGYRQAFAEVHGTGVDATTMARSLSTFVRGLTHGDTVVDAFLFEGARDEMTVDERAGMWIYESKGRCWQCHTRPNYSDEQFHNTGIGAVDGVPAPGRAAVTGDPADRGRFKTPTLRGLTDTAPYMHDGSLATLADVVAFYRRGGNKNDNLSPLMAPLEISDTEARQLVAFLEALSRPRKGHKGAHN